MTDRNSPKDITALRKAFAAERNNASPFIYYPIESKNGNNTSERIGKLIQGYRRSGFRGLIPYADKNSDIKSLSDEYYTVYERICKECRNNAFELAYLDDTYVMREYIARQEDASECTCKILCRYDYACTEKQHISRKTHDNGILMSIVAINDDTLEILDLRQYVTSDGVLEWDVPDGNWNVEEYICEPDTTSNYIDAMDYDVCTEYLRKTFGLLLQKLDYESAEPPICTFIVRNIMFAGKNRRMWNPDFNKTFENRYGFSPAPYYPLLFREFLGYSRRYKALLVEHRSKMLIDGYMKAAADFCSARNIFCTGFPAESKCTACSWMFGDGQLLHKYASAPGISMPFAYLYGLNGIKVAAGAADSMGIETVTADLFKYFLHLNRDIIYRECMNAYVRGVNMVFSHLGEDRTNETTEAEFSDKSITRLSPWGSIFSKGDDLKDFATFATRAQTALRGGNHVCEAAIVYPIHSLHSSMYLYQSDVEGFEYPQTPENADYMELMNNMLNYVGVDTMFLHPVIMAKHAYAENGTLFVSNESCNNIISLKLVVLPSTSVISLGVLRVLKKFFNEGGKIIAADSLPNCAYEYSRVNAENNMTNSLRSRSAEDEEVREIIEYIFGADVSDTHLYKRYYKNTSPNGGVAFFFPSNKTSVDGSDSLSADILAQAVNKCGYVPDVFIDKMPRREFLGVVNQNLPVFMRVGIDKRLAKGCSMNYIHKKYAGCDIYFITNTTGNNYNGSILLRGILSPEEWNPYTGKTRKIAVETVKFMDTVYTKIDASIGASSCVFYVSPISPTTPELPADGYKEFFAHQTY